MFWHHNNILGFEVVVFNLLVYWLQLVVTAFESAFTEHVSTAIINVAFRDPVC